MPGLMSIMKSQEILLLMGEIINIIYTQQLTNIPRNALSNC